MASNAYRDTTVDPAKARHLQVVWDGRVKKLAKQTGFDEYELQALCLIFHKICETHEWWGSEIAKDRVDRLDRVGFRDGVSVLLDMPDTESLDALFGAMDPDNKRYITAGRWIKALDALKGSATDRGRLCWRAYRRGEGGALSRADMTAHARNMFVDVGIDNFDYFCKEFVDVMLKDTKAGKEGVMPQSEYLDIVSRRPLFAEFLLAVLPPRRALDALLATFRPPAPRPRPRGHPYGRPQGRPRPQRPPGQAPAQPAAATPTAPAAPV